MKLSRNTLRSLAVGFLASAVVTAAFALSQGQLPVQGVNGTNLLNGGSTTANADQQAQLDALSSEKSALESTQNVLNASLTSLKVLMLSATVRVTVIVLPVTFCSVILNLPFAPANSTV